MSHVLPDMKGLLTTALPGLVLTFTSIAAAKPGWDDDYEKSLAKAKAEGKLVLLDFTGSDWCGWCMKLDDEVFSKNAFKQFAKHNLVLVELDYPNLKRLPKKVAEQNATLKTKYGVSGYPTIVLLSSDGKELQRWPGYVETLLDELKQAVPATAGDAAAPKR